ncbi:uncharacterized protein LOC102803237 [Saccoglossus kowalevskii]|uniref:Tachykinin-like peptides receptor 99D-like n=1 Tax=Saccoglossus kowalevskii TaxID=10224 RepID=A0ABM0LUR0_SACKO|nr:PREDICTED: tachykinin-like peptides receptor 99D-like [Saccoglossus kowalevskii]
MTSPAYNIAYSRNTTSEENIVIMTSTTFNITYSENLTSEESYPMSCPFANADAEFMIYILSTIIALAGNLAFFIVVSKVKVMRTVTNVFFMNLSVADIIFSCYYLFYSIAEKWQLESFLKFDMQGGQAITDIGFCASLLIVALISINRYIAICFPFKALQLRLQSKSRVVTSLTVCWLYSIVVALLDVISYINYTDRTLIIVVILLMIICITLSVVTVMTTYTLITINMFTRTPPRYSSPNNSEQFHTSDETRVLFVCVTITVVFFICCIPLAAYYVILAIKIISGISVIPIRNSICLRYIARVMIPLQFAANPIIYNTGSKNHRAAFRKVFWPKSQHAQLDSNREINRSPRSLTKLSMEMPTCVERPATLETDT